MWFPTGVVYAIIDLALKEENDTREQGKFVSRFTVYQDNTADTTTVSNLFIDEYMKDANDAQIKIYLYLLRMMGAHRATSISDIADKFNHTEKDVTRALKYWEKNRLLTLEYDEEKTLIGIRLLDVTSRTCNDVLPLRKLVTISSSAPAGQAEAVSSFGMQETASDPYEKPSYSLDDLKEFKDNDETAQILFVAEQYIGKPLSANEMKTILFFSDRLHFSIDLIDYLLQYCVGKGKKDFRYIEKVAVSWAQEGITSPAEASKHTRKYDKIVYDVMNALGKNTSPTRTEAAYVMKWVNQYGFEKDILMEACERTVLATDRHRFAYADSILTSWHNGNVHHKSDIRSMDEAHSTKSTERKNVKTGQFHQFMQNDYDFETLEKELLSN